MKTRVLQLIRVGNVAALLAFFRALFFCRPSIRPTVCQPASQPASQAVSLPVKSQVLARLEVAWGSSSSSTAAPSHCGTMQPRASPSAQPQPPQHHKSQKQHTHTHTCISVCMYEAGQALALLAQPIIFQYANVLALRCLKMAQRIPKRSWDAATRQAASHWRNSTAQYPVKGKELSMALRHF